METKYEVHRGVKIRTKVFNLVCGILFYIKVSKSGQQILKFLFQPKIERKDFCIPALASKSGQIRKSKINK